MRPTKLYIIILTTLVVVLTACEREPLLHLFDGGNVEVEIPVVDLELDAYWDYEMSYDIAYNWRAEWYYGWDEVDDSLFGPIGYTDPQGFELRRYFTGMEPYAPHNSVLRDNVQGHHFQGKYNWGFWDILVWNDVEEKGGSRALDFDEATSLDHVTAFTYQTLHSARYQAPKYTRSFNQPEDLFTAYRQAIEINRNLDGFDYDPERNVWVMTVDMLLQPVTYIYLTQVVLLHNNGRVYQVDGSSNLSGMASAVKLNDGVAGETPITVYYNTRLKTGLDYEIRHENATEAVKADIVGGRVMTFGICGQNSHLVEKYEDVKDEQRHYMDVNMYFNNGMDSTFVFDVTDQVRHRWKGGVITVVLDMDTVPTPKRKGGSAFDAIVKDYEEMPAYEFEM